jgi:uncharacterized protein
MTAVQEDDRLVVEAININDAATVERVVAARPEAAKAVDDARVSALMLARYYGRDEIAGTLQNSIPEIDEFEASAYGDLDRIRVLAAVDESLVNRHSPDGFTALQLASYFGSYQVASFLLDKGADANAVAGNGTRVQALHSAVSNHHTDVVRLLLSHGANVNAQQEGGFTPCTPRQQMETRTSWSYCWNAEPT